jgi:hypothetical protein
LDLGCELVDALLEGALGKASGFELVVVALTPSGLVLELRFDVLAEIFQVGLARLQIAAGLAPSVDEDLGFL